MKEKRELSRSEIARQRRAQRTVSELKQTKQRATRPAPPPVTSRVSSTPVLSKARRGSNRNHYNVAFGLTEARLKKRGISLPSFSGDWRTTSLVSIVLLGAIIYLAFTLPYFRVTGATVLGNNRLSAEEINAVLGVSGDSIFMIKPDKVSTQLLMNYPELATAQVSVSPPNHVQVTVVERQPVILWQQSGGMTWIDAMGVAFVPRGQVTGLVVVDGLGMPPVVNTPDDTQFGPKPFVQKELISAILALAPSVPADSTMIYDPTYGLGWKDSRGWNAFFGTGLKDMPMKATVYQSLVNSLVEQGRTPVLISVAYPSAPYYRMSESSSP